MTEIGGRWLEPEAKIDKLAPVSLTRELLQPEWQILREMTHKQLYALLDEYRRDALLRRWPEMNLGALDGLSPRQAAEKPECRARLAAVLLVLQHYLDQVHCAFDVNELRTSLGLPVLEPIVSEEGKIDDAPLYRLDRLVAEKLSDADLCRAFQRAVSFSHLRAMIKFGRAIVERSSLEGQPARQHAYSILSRLEVDLDKALEYIEAGRREIDKIGKSNASWDLQELSLRFARQELPLAVELIRHIESAHIREPNVSYLLTQQLIRVGLLRPDGSPAYPARRPDEEAAAVAAAAEPGKLWTPDSEGSAGGGKLWVPE